jgi:hypothetical protein
MDFIDYLWFKLLVVFLVCAAYGLYKGFTEP